MKNKHPIRILLSGGGTGGHLTPLVALINYYKKHYPEHTLFFIGTKKGQEQQVIPTLNIPFYTIDAPKLRRYFSLHNLLDIFKIPKSLCQAFRHVRHIKPDIVLTTGGYVTLPVIVISWLCHIPLVIHEQTLQSGIVNRFAARMAKKIAVSFVQSKKYFPTQKVVITGNPIRSQLFQFPPRNLFSFQNSLPTLYVTGSYQGSHFINRFIGTHLELLLKKMNVIHQCGNNPQTNDYEWLIQQHTAIKQPPIKPQYVLLKTAEEDQLSSIYQKATLILSRAGATTIAEISALGKPAILIPYPYAASQEQLKLALLLHKHHAVELFIQTEVEKNQKMYFEKIITIITDSTVLEQLSSNIKKFGHREAVEKLAQLLLEIASY